MCRWTLAVLVVSAWVAFSAPVGRGDDAAVSEATTRYFRELRRRGLFRLAEAYSLERLSRSGLAIGERTDLTLELSRTLAEHADFVGSSEQDALWARSDAALADLLKQEPDNPRKLLLEVQRALLPAAIGHSRRLVVELDPYDAAAQKRAMETLQAAAEGLRAVEASVAARSRKGSAPAAASKGGLRPFEIRPLLAHVRVRLGGALLDLAHLGSSESPDRIALLIDAQKVFKSVGEAADDSELMWQARLDYVECTRLLGDYARALREIESLEKFSPPEAAADRLLAEKVRGLMAQRSFRDAAAALAERDRDARPSSGELQSLAIELAIAEWRAANRASDAKVPKRMAQALEERAERLRREAGGYWLARSELMIRQVQDAQQYGAELAALVGKAQGAFSAGEAAQAADLYGQAAALARRDGRSDLAFQFGFTQGSIDIKARNWDRAATGLLELTEKFPKNPKAPQAHLLAAYARGKAADEEPTDARRDEYARVLEQHRTRFAEDATLAEATWMLAEFDERLGRIEAALGLYQLIPAEHKRGAAAQRAVARCGEQVLDGLRERGEPTGKRETEIIETLTKRLPSLYERGPPLDVPQADLAVRLARILLRAAPPQYDRADRWLARAVDGLAAIEAASSDLAAEEEAERSELRSSIRRLQVISLAGQQKFQPARKLLDEISSSSPSELLRILDGLAPLQADETRDPFRELGELQLACALKLDPQRAELSQADQRRLDVCLARGYFAVGQSEKGIATCERLLRQYPRDRELPVTFAGLLARSGSRESLKRAAAVWLKLEALYEPGSREWFPVRYELCRALLAAGETAEARKLLQVTRLVYPKPEDGALEKKFAALEDSAAVSASRGK